jgi:RNA polymerase sigma factor (TIGR02999 family)
MRDPGDVDALLSRARGGDRDALERLLPVVYDELRRIAAGYLKHERQGHTLQPTALVNEAYLRLLGQREVDWRNRAQFLGVAAQTMRRILVDHARARAAAKRGGMQTRVTLDEGHAVSAGDDVDVIALDEALGELAELDPRLARVVELRFFGGLTNPEVAETLGISIATVDRERATAVAWLRRRLG